MRLLLLGLLFMVMTACEAGHLTPYSLPVKGLVQLEDFCEDPLEDVQTLTPLEAIADMFVLPLTIAIWTVRLVAYTTVGLGMVIARKDSQSSIEQINWILPFSLAGPNPDRVKYHMGMVKGEGCLGF